MQERTEQSGQKKGEIQVPGPAQAGIMKYLDKAVETLQSFGMTEREEESRLAKLLQEVVHVDEPNVLAIARVVEKTGAFDDLVRDKIEEVRIGQRYQEIVSMFDSIREDSHTLVEQLGDGRIDLKERMRNLWMKIARGTPHRRFEKIRENFLEVSDDTKLQLDNEDAIMDAYMDFRFAIKEAETLGYQVLEKQKSVLDTSKARLTESADKVKGYQGQDPAERSRLEMQRDEAMRVVSDEDRRYDLMKDVAENLRNSYNIGEALVAKLKQTHDVKERVYRRAVTFFETNRQIFSIMDAIYTSQHGLHEATQTMEAMTTGVEKGIEQIAELGKDLEKAALKAGYGATINATSVQKLVDAVVSFQEEQITLVGQLREESTKNAEEIRRVVEDGKERYRSALEKYLAAPTGTKAD